MMKAAYGKRTSTLKDRAPEEKFENGDLANGKMLSLEGDELKVLREPNHIKNGLQHWKNLSKRNILRKKQKLILNESSSSENSPDKKIQDSLFFKSNEKFKPGDTNSKSKNTTLFSNPYFRQFRVESPRNRLSSRKFDSKSQIQIQAKNQNQ
jgi:hypothetical protein